MFFFLKFPETVRAEEEDQVGLQAPGDPHDSSTDTCLTFPYSSNSSRPFPPSPVHPVTDSPIRVSPLFIVTSNSSSNNSPIHRSTGHNSPTPAPSTPPVPTSSQTLTFIPPVQNIDPSNNLFYTPYFSSFFPHTGPIVFPGSPPEFPYFGVPLPGSSSTFSKTASLPSYPIPSMVTSTAKPIPFFPIEPQPITSFGPCRRHGPLVYLSASGTPVGDTQTKKESDERYVPMNFLAVDKSVLTPQGRQEMKGMASPIKFMETLQNGDALKINPQGGSMMEALGFGPEKVEEKDPDFYMPDGQGKKLSESYQMFTNEQTPEGNPGVIVKLSNLVKKYRTSIYLMDRKFGHLYVLDKKGYKQIEEKGLLYPSESMIIAGALDENRGNPFIMT